jgi:hypothetical protein
MEPRSGARRKLKPRRIVNYITSRWPAIDAYSSGWICSKEDELFNSSAEYPRTFS